MPDNTILDDITVSITGDSKKDETLHNAVLKRISSVDLLRLGRGHVAYIKSVKVEEGQAYALFSAEGKSQGVFADIDSAIQAAWDTDVSLATVH